MDCAALAVAQLEKLDERQRALLATLRQQRASGDRAKEIEQIFAEIPEYVRKLDRLSSNMSALSAQTASMRVRSAQLAAEHGTLREGPDGDESVVERGV